MATGTLAETVVEEVASNLEEAAEVTRRVNPKSVGLFMGGVSLGALVGFMIGYRYNREKIRQEAFAESEREVDEIREMYRKERAVVVLPDKPTVNEIIEERGYLDAQPELPERPLKPPVVVSEQSKEYVQTGPWNYATELARRDPTRPYVIHEEEFQVEGSGFNHVTYTYFSEDGYVMDDEDQQPFTDVDERVGLANLTRFGHGTNDPDIVFIRNHKLNIEIELARVEGSYQRDVEGLEPDEDETDSR